MKHAFLFAALLVTTLPVQAAMLNGTNKSDVIVSTGGDDTITTLKGADKLIFRKGFGNDHVTDFNAAAGDRLLFDINGCYSDIMFLGKLTDVRSQPSCNNGHFEFSASGGSTMIRAYDSNTLQGTVILDGVTIESLYGWALQGG